jgi:hypothetical protein
LMANPWFRMWAEFADDPKVQRLPEAMQRRLVMIFCYRCSNVLATLQEAELAKLLRITDTELKETKAEFVRSGFIDKNWEISNWAKRQFLSDSSTSRSRRCREAKKQKPETDCNVAATLQERSGSCEATPYRITDIQNTEREEKEEASASSKKNETPDYAKLFKLPAPPLEALSGIASEIFGLNGYRDVPNEILKSEWRNALAWAEENPEKAKQKDIRRFWRSWLSRWLGGRPRNLEPYRHNPNDTLIV